MLTVMVDDGNQVLSPSPSHTSHPSLSLSHLSPSHTSLPLTLSPLLPSLIEPSRIERETLPNNFD